MTRLSPELASLQNELDISWFEVGTIVACKIFKSSDCVLQQLEIHVPHTID